MGLGVIVDVLITYLIVTFISNMESNDSSQTIIDGVIADDKEDTIKKDIDSPEVIKENINLDKLDKNTIIKEKEIPKTYNQKTFIFNVAGTTYDNDEGYNIQKLLKGYVKEWLTWNESYEGLSNDEIVDRIYEADVYDFSDITFQHNPNNEHDKNAIKVIHSELGHIGHIPKNKNKEFLEYMNFNFHVDGNIVGGKYKYYDYFEDRISIKTNNYGVKLYVTFELE